MSSRMMDRVGTSQHPAVAIAAACCSVSSVPCSTERTPAATARSMPSPP